MAELALDVVEQILLQLDVKDLIRCNSVCKLWRSLISSPRFIKAQLNHSYNHDRQNHELGHIRICFPISPVKDSWFYRTHVCMVGSCNGLLCLFCTRDFEFLVTNPLTRHEKKLSTPPHMLKTAMIRRVACWGFGYDSSEDDYKVVAGFNESVDKTGTLFHALTLKSNTWKVIAEVECGLYAGASGILCDGSLHWFMVNKHKKKIIVSLNLSTDKFEEIPVPLPDLLYKDDFYHTLGVMKDCLCIYPHPSHFTRKRWGRKNNNWELYDNHYESKYDVAHRLTTSNYVVDNGTRVPSNGDYIGTCIFVKSLVSPNHHVNNDGQKRNAKHGEEGNESVKSSAKVYMRRRKRNEMR